MNETSYKNISNKKLSSENECPIIDSLRMMITEYQGINIYTEDMMRGEGVLELFIENNIKILNIDKTLFGSIQLTKDGYNIQFPKKIIAREVYPQSEYKVFSFDSETPNIDKDFLIIYINKEKKMVDKKSVKFKFIKWDDYIKSAFVKTYDSKNEHWYKAIEIKNDSMLVKSVSSANCDYFEDHKEKNK
ncbi:hypothetical protein [Empedobacter falsenii]